MFLNSGWFSLDAEAARFLIEVESEISSNIAMELKRILIGRVVQIKGKLVVFNIQLA